MGNGANFHYFQADITTPLLREKLINNIADVYEDNPTYFDAIILEAKNEAIRRRFLSLADTESTGAGNQYMESPKPCSEPLSAEISCLRMQPSIYIGDNKIKLVDYLSCCFVIA